MKRCNEMKRCGAGFPASVTGSAKAARGYGEKHHGGGSRFESTSDLLCSSPCAPPREGARWPVSHARAHARILTQAIRTESLKSSFRSVSQGRVRHEP